MACTACRKEKGYVATPEEIEAYDLSRQWSKKQCSRCAKPAHLGAGMACKDCRKEKGYVATPEEIEAYDLYRQKNKLKSAKNNHKNNAKATAARRLSKMRSLAEEFLNSEDDVALTTDELDRHIITTIQEMVRQLHTKGKEAKRNSLLGMCLGDNPFNVTISAMGRIGMEFGCKMARPGPAIVHKNQRKLTLHEDGSLVDQVLLAKCKF